MLPLTFIGFTIVIKGYFYYYATKYNTRVEACTLYSNIDDQYFTSSIQDQDGAFCRHETESDLYDDANSFAGRKCQNYDCAQP